jgi:F-box and leucine-rich repeat protein GRR1
MSVFEIAANLPKLRRVGLVKVIECLMNEVGSSIDFCHVHKVVNITDQAIYALVERGERGVNCMERVHLSYCDKLSVKAITHLLRKVPHITHLSLTGVSAFRNWEYQRFCRPAPKVSVNQVNRDANPP